MFGLPATLLGVRLIRGFASRWLRASSMQGVHALIVSGLAVIIVWSLFSRVLERFRIAGPLAVIVLGALSGLLFGEDLGEHLDTDVAEKVVEIVLAVLLFVDATEVRRGFLGGEGRIVARLLSIGLPGALILTSLACMLLLPGTPWAVILVLACIITPTDFAASAGMLRDTRVPSRVRHSLNVESGYNDGLVSPLFIFALAVAEGQEAQGIGPALESALWASLIAVLVGAIVGGATGVMMQVAHRKNWLTAQSLRIGIVMIPLLVYVLAIQFNGNGFVAAFVAGIAFRSGRLEHRRSDSSLDHAEMSAVDDLGLLSSLGVWFVFGAVIILAAETGVNWVLIALGVLALTVLRVVPVHAALWGSALRWRERTAIGLAGPRGTASVVFGLLAFNALREDYANLALYLTIVVVLGSVVFHGVIAPRMIVALTHDASAAPATTADKN